MVRTMEYLCQNIQGAKLGYTQSDEITILLTDYDTLETDAWFDYEVQKICSISASMATMAFNTFFKNEVDKFYYNHCSRKDLLFEKHYQPYRDAQYKGVMFDARCFNIPKEEATNLIYWRQLDATRNSIQMVGQANFSHSQLQGCSCNLIKDMLYDLKHIAWEDYPTRWKRGVAWTKEKGIDYNMPILKGEDRKYVDELIYVGG